MVTTGPIAESPQASQVEGRAVVGRRVRDLVFLDRLDDLSSRERAAAVLVDHFKAMPRRVEELARKFCNLLRRRLALRLARGGPLRQLVGQRGLDRVLPLGERELAVAVRVHLGQRRVEARGHQEILEVLVAAVCEEVDHFFVSADRLDLCVDQTSRHASESRPPLH